MTAVPAGPLPAGEPLRPPVRLIPVPRPVPSVFRRPGGTPALSLVPADPTVPVVDPMTWRDADEEPPRPPDLGVLPDPRRWAALLAQAVVEILGGRRPAAQVLRWVDPEIHERLKRSAPSVRRVRGGPPVRVRRVRISTSLEGAVEAVAVVDDGTRCRAMAMRFEALERRWLCTALDLV